MDEASPSSDNDYVAEEISDTEPGPSSRWNLRKRKRESVDLTSPGRLLSDAPRRPTARRRHSAGEEHVGETGSISISRVSPFVPRAGEGQGRQAAVFPYIDIFNSTLHDFLSGQYVDSEEIEDLEGWTADERDKFHCCLQQLHYVDFTKISELTGKSRRDVQNRLKRLEEQIETYRSREDLRDELAFPHEFPAAIEMSASGMALLEAAAKRLRKREFAHELQYARRLYGRYAIIDQNAATDLSQMETWLELRLLPNFAQEREEQSSEDQGQGSRSRDLDDSELFMRHHERLIEAAQLLRPRKFLELSERLFMNSGLPRQEDNWTALTIDSKPPSMMRTSFTDFYTLALRLTKKLVAASLFHAEARTNVVVLDDGEDGVSTRDVENAARTLDLKCSWKKYWVNVAQRCNVQVFDEPAQPSSSSTNPDPVWLSPDEVETALADESGSAPNPTVLDTLSSSSSTRSDEEEIPALPFDGEADPDAAYDDYLDAFDDEMGRQHEVGLFKTLERTIPSYMRQERALPRAPRIHLGEHANPNGLRDMLERSSDVDRLALELSSIRNRHRSSAAITDLSSNIKEDTQPSARPQSPEQMDNAVNDNVGVDESAHHIVKSPQTSSEDEEPIPRKWKGKGRAVPFPTGISRIEDLVYSSDGN